MLKNGLKYSDVTVKYALPTAAQAAFSSGKVEIWAIFGVFQATAVAQGARVLIEGGAASHADEYAKVYSDKNGVPLEVAKVVVSWGSTALLPVGPEVIAKVQPVSDLMHGVGVLPANVKVADYVDATVFTTAG